MAKHTISYKKGSQWPKTRAICSCGALDEEANDNVEAKQLVGQHLKDVVNEMKPQKSLDI